MYKVYYLTSYYDFGIPMYIGMTKLSLKERLREHIYHTHGHSKKDAWKNLRNKEITIHLIQDKISNFSKCSNIELSLINFWKNINPELKNSIIYKLSEHPYINMIENIRKNISDGVITKRCRSIVVLTLNQEFIQEYKTIRSASTEIGVKEEIITKNLKNLTKAKKYIFLYKDEYNPSRDYSYKIYDAKKRKRPKIKPIVSENCRKSRLKAVKVIDIKTGIIKMFRSQQEVCNYIGCSSSLITQYKKNGRLIRNTFKFL